MTQTERPILFSAEMVRAILEGKKTQTRRVIKPQGGDEVMDGMLWRPDIYGDWHPIMDYCPFHNHMNLWVRETWRRSEINLPDGIEYRADTELRFFTGGDNDVREKAALLPRDGNWRPSIFMPRWASRITLEVTGVRVERVQEINDDDAIEEGVDRANTSIPTYARQRFQKLWDSINDKRGFGWDANPWVWVVQFRVVQP